MLPLKKDVNLQDASSEGVLQQMLDYSGCVPMKGPGVQCDVTSVSQGIESWRKNEIMELRKKMWLTTATLESVLQQSSHLITSLQGGSIAGYAAIRHRVLPDTLNVSTQIVEFGAQAHAKRINATALEAVAKKIVSVSNEKREKLFYTFASLEQYLAGMRGSSAVTMKASDYVSRAEVEKFHDDVQKIPSALQSFSALHIKGHTALLNAAFGDLSANYEDHPFILAISELEDIAKLRAPIATATGDEVHCRYLERIAHFWANILKKFVHAINQKGPKATLYIEPYGAHYDTFPKHTHEEVRVNLQHKQEGRWGGYGTFRFPTSSDETRMEFFVNEDSPSALSAIAASLLEEIPKTQWYRQNQSRRFQE